MTDTPGERLRKAREKAGYGSATEAARSRGWTVSTYLGHENGDRVPSRATAKRYGKAFKVNWAWILEGDEIESVESSLPISGVIHAGGKVEFDENRTDKAPSPPEGADDTTALLAGSSVMPGLIEEGWIVYCQKARRSPIDSDIGKTSLICLESEEIFIGRLFRGRDGLYDAISVTFESRRDVRVKWVSTVTWIKPA